mgnify:CR=1 FL=1
MAERVVNIFADPNETFPVTVVFSGQELEFTLRKLAGGDKYKVWNDCVGVIQDGSLSIDFHLYFITMMSRMIVSNPSTFGELTPDEVHRIHGDILSQLEVYVPQIGSGIPTVNQEMIKKA